ncbi:MAG: ATP-binding protein [Dehalococcoidia bacterium]|nr:ATP-binding protein [Dehalococcoidia bacterium]
MTALERHALAAHEEWARSCLAREGISDDLLDELVLGLHEVLANVIAHADPPCDVGLVIEIRQQPEGLSIEIVTTDGGR